MTCSSGNSAMRLQSKVISRSITYCCSGDVKISANSPACMPSEKYSLDDLKETAVADGVELKPGTILLIRTGWMQAYIAASPEHKAAMAPLGALKACGIDDSSAMVEWFWDHRLAAVGTDCPPGEPWPWDFSNEGALHYRPLCLLACP